MHGEHVHSTQTLSTRSGFAEQQCRSLCEQLGFEIDIRVLAASSDVSGEIQVLTQAIDALIVSNENFSGSADSIAIEELRSFEMVTERGIPIVEVHEQNIFVKDDTRPYLDSPGIVAGLVSGMGQSSYLFAIRALASMMESNAV